METLTMAHPALAPVHPTPGLWFEMKLVWRRKHIAFYQGPHLVEPLMAGDLDTLRAAEVMIEWELTADPWPSTAHFCDEPVPGAGRPGPRALPRAGGHDHDDRRLRPACRSDDGDGGGLRDTAGAVGRDRARLMPQQRTGVSS
ncbi:hypothetical protein ACIBHY_29685 [Nonomuraea sp. NPDC050547]|uniref:hypothetical protein n=1 Tax=Nonomuraea sp. NPDC050547 TaxID=3364368 RepID=UPI0037A25CAC